MAITIPETEPLDFYSGETVKWKQTDLSDYPVTTTGYTVGLYRWIVEARDGTDVYVVDEGYMGYYGTGR